MQRCNSTHLVTLCYLRLPRTATNHLTRPIEILLILHGPQHHKDPYHPCPTHLLWSSAHGVLRCLVSTAGSAQVQGTPSFLG
ncbi:uncharacterized protein LOC122263931 isoform X2 [Penaeus japonicus]|uniref:uncharacterized protein LOC122263931 isoform X2 n=1 Tax=Penaeus japonicus TaxID=27405 RepID=UPI001C70D490|nr:uncharacterized protein LOC122263931 isoform X2 [Penaeus japonicus]